MLVASGVSYRQLDAPGFAELTGAGIYYGAALTEARACADQHVVVIGGANSAGQAAVYFSGYAGRVTMLVRARLADEVDVALSDRADRGAAERRGANRRAGGRRRRRGRPSAALRIRAADGERDASSRPTRASCSSAPRRAPTGSRASSRATSAASSSPAPTSREHGWPLTREPYVLETSVPGVFVAGDVRTRSIKRVASAVGEGSMAVSLIHEYLADA